MKKIVLLSLVIMLVGVLSAQLLDDLALGDKDLDGDIVELRYAKKSAQKAMLYSALFPGAGQFYVNKKSVLAYVFPVIEIGLIATYVNQFSKGDDVTKQYKQFADTNYSRDRQHRVEQDLINHPTAAHSIYVAGHFRLDDDNTQHFYEDIGKYNKYIFGWQDWYDNYVDEISSTQIWCDWVFGGVGTTNPNDIVWIGNRPINPPDGYGQNEFDSPDNGSALRAEYIQMRKDAEKHYSSADNLRFFLMANHIVSTFDALRATNKYNRNYLRTVSLQPSFETVVFNNNVTPVFNLSCKF